MNRARIASTKNNSAEGRAHNPAHHHLIICLRTINTIGIRGSAAIKIIIAPHPLLPKEAVEAAFLAHLGHSSQLPVPMRAKCR